MEPREAGWGHVPFCTGWFRSTLCHVGFVAGCGRQAARSVRGLRLDPGWVGRTPSSLAPPPGRAEGAGQTLPRGPFRKCGCASVCPAAGGALAPRVDFPSAATLGALSCGSLPPPQVAGLPGTRGRRIPPSWEGGPLNSAGD